MRYIRSMDKTYSSRNAIQPSLMYVTLFFCFCFCFRFWICVCVRARFFSFEMGIWWSLTFSFTYIIHTYNIGRYSEQWFLIKMIDLNMDRGVVVFVCVFGLVDVCFDFYVCCWFRSLSLCCILFKQTRIHMWLLHLYNV